MMSMPIVLSFVSAATLAGQVSPVTPVVATADELTLDWPAQTILSMEADGGETIMRFDRVPDAVSLEAFRRAAGTDLTRMYWNDTSMVIRPAPGRTFVPNLQGTRLSIRIVRDAPVGSDVVTEPLDYSLARAAAESASGYPGRARQMLLTLARSLPDDPQLTRTMADMDASRGATLRAARRYRSLNATDAYASRTIRAAGGEVSAIVAARDGGGFGQVEASVRATVPVAAAPNGLDTVVGGAIRQVRTRADAVVARDGNIRTLRRHIALAEVTGSIGDATTRLELLGAGNLSQTRVGLAARLLRGPVEREWRLAAAYHLPDVLTAEQVLLGGYVDRWGGGVTWRSSPAVQVQGDIVRTLYGLTREGILATSTVVTGGVDATVRRLNPALTLLYRLEAEYVDRLDQRANGLAALPLADRENHTVQALVAEQLGPWRLVAAAGWTFDRFGGSGPTAALTAAGFIGDAWQAEATGGVSSIRRPNLAGTQLFARVGLRRSMGRL